MQPRGVFGIPHGVLSSTDEHIAFAIGLVALVGSFAAPAAVSNEWHIPVLVVVLVVGSVAFARHRG
ncbi:hypothetical protein [Halobacterium zhouii]|uniref:hypothetical protein n=1 Tax=Halobacterium zhouii TaxID=2902624 RepID=UPI001E2D1468|nr:hypothetical protein [Halobacterium zhouii]